eukprot:5159359-Lingulodinium_polyedra.AAC.1
MWARPGPRAIAIASLCTRFNERVKCDLPFYAQYIVLNVLGEAIRWRVVVEVPSRREEPPLSVFMTSWVQVFGAPTCLVVDGESLLAGGEAGVL